jgi:hypothetical protein
MKRLKGLNFRQLHSDKDIIKGVEKDPRSAGKIDIFNQKNDFFISGYARVGIPFSIFNFSHCLSAHYFGRASFDQTIA